MLIHEHTCVIDVINLFMFRIKIIARTVDHCRYVHMCNDPVKNTHCEGEARQVRALVFPMSSNQMKCFLCATKVLKVKIANVIH